MPGGPVPVPDLVFLTDYRAEVKLSAASKAIWGVKWAGSGARFGLSFGSLDRSRDFTPATPDFGQEVKIYFFNFDFLWKKVRIRRNITPDPLR